MATNECAEIVAAAVRAASAPGTDWTNILVALTALAAVIFGPLISIYTVNRETRAAVHSQHRQAWINALRTNIADLFMLYHRAKRLLHRTGPIDQVAFDEIIDRSKQLELTIQLQLNPREDEHKNLVEFIKETALLVPNNTKDIIDNENKIVALVQTVLKKEWERVKAIK